MSRADQLSRVLRVASALAASKRGLPLKTLAERHDWNLRALYRDIASLGSAGYQVIENEGRYRIAGDVPALAAGVTREELLALFLARQLVPGLQDTSIGRALERLWAKLSSEKGQPALLPPGETPRLTMRSPLTIDYGAHRKILATLERATQERLAISCRYRALSTGELTKRILEPGDLHFDPALETWYLIAWCRLRNAVRVFAVHRFVMASLTKERISERPETSSKSALQHAFRVWRGDAVERVTIDFSPARAGEIRERKWHPSQRLTPLDGGGVRLTVEVAGVTEVERWVLGFGAEARVVEPGTLVERVREQLAAAQRLYAAPLPSDAVKIRADRS